MFDTTTSDCVEAKDLDPKANGDLLFAVNGATLGLKSMKSEANLSKTNGISLL